MTWSSTTRAWCALAYMATAFGGADVAAQTPADDDLTDPLSGRSNRVVFLVPDELDPKLEQPLRDAVAAQFALTQIELELRADPGTGKRLGERLSEASALARERNAFAVLWIEQETDERWLLHMLDPASDRLVVRALDVGPEHESAATEAIAVMARDSAEALLTGQEIPTQDVTTLPPETAAGGEPAATPTPTATAPAAAPTETMDRITAAPSGPARWRSLRLALGYFGTDFAEAAGYQHGAGLRASWHLRNGLFFGLGYSLLAAVDVPGLIPFTVTRHPIEVHGGFRWRPLDELRLDGVLAITLDLLERRTTPATAPPLMSDDPSLRPIVALGPRGRLEWAPIPALALYALGGLDVLINNFDYIVRLQTDEVLLRGLSPRPVVEGGFVYYP